jgi:hypothetical protein
MIVGILFFKNHRQLQHSLVLPSELLRATVSLRRLTIISVLFAIRRQQQSGGVVPFISLLQKSG